MDGFKKFLLRGNVVDLAVAVVIGAAFGRIVTSFASAFISPLVLLVTGATGDVKDEGLPRRRGARSPTASSSTPSCRSSSSRRSCTSWWSGRCSA